MLFQRSKDKQESAILETPRHVEEETVRRWRDIAAARSSGGENKIVVGRFEDEMAYSSSHSGCNTEAPTWPETKNIELGENNVIDDNEPTQEDFLNTENYSLGKLSLEEEVTEVVHIPPIQRGEHLDAQHHDVQHHDTEHLNAEPQIQQPQRIATSDSSLSVEDDLKQRFGSNIRSALGPGTVIEGTFRFDSPVCVEGTLSGEVYSSSVLIVGDGASITGKITVGSLIILGQVEGSVEAEELVEIRSTGTLYADIITKRIAIEDGGKFNGRCTPQED